MGIPFKLKSSAAELMKNTQTAEEKERSKRLAQQFSNICPESDFPDILCINHDHEEERYCTVQESLIESCKEVKLMREGKKEKPTLQSLWGILINGRKKMSKEATYIYMKDIDSMRIILNDYSSFLETSMVVGNIGDNGIMIKGEENHVQIMICDYLKMLNHNTNMIPFNYDSDNDIVYFFLSNSQNEYGYSEELYNGIVFHYTKSNNIIGLTLFDYKKRATDPRTVQDKESQL